MGVEKVKIASISFKYNWYTVKDSTGREISIPIVHKEKGAVNPKLTVTLAATKEGDEVELDTREHEGKWYGNDPKAGGNGAKSFAPKDKSFEAAIAAAKSTGSMLAGRSEISPAAFNTLFEHVHKQIMSKVTK
jgi:hypothetical protein